MIIRIESDGHKFIIPLPLRLALNRITIPLIAGCVEKHTDISLKQEHLKALIEELITVKKSFKNLVLVDVVSSDGSKVKITL